MENDTLSTWFEYAGIIFFTFMVVTVGILWGLALKASYNEEKKKQKQQSRKQQQVQGNVNE